MLKSIRARAGDVYCPSGHVGTWKTSEAELMRRERDAARTERDEARAEAARKDRLLAAQKAQATKLRNRVANGVCPCCNRTFVKLGRHMATKHPDFKTQELG